MRRREHHRRCPGADWRLEPDGGYDRRAMIGHVFLWDPLFLVWGLLVAGLYVTRDGRVI